MTWKECQAGLGNDKPRCNAGQAAVVGVAWRHGWRSPCGNVGVMRWVPNDETRTSIDLDDREDFVWAELACALTASRVGRGSEGNETYAGYTRLRFGSC